MWGWWEKKKGWGTSALTQRDDNGRRLCSHKYSWKSCDGSQRFLVCSSVWCTWGLTSGCAEGFYSRDVSIAWTAAIGLMPFLHKRHRRFPLVTEQLQHRWNWDKNCKRWCCSDGARSKLTLSMTDKSCTAWIFIFSSKFRLIGTGQV